MLRETSGQGIIEVNMGGANKYWGSFPLRQIRIDCCVATQVWRRLLFQTDRSSASVGDGVRPSAERAAEP